MANIKANGPGSVKPPTPKPTPVVKGGPRASGGTAIQTPVAGGITAIYTPPPTGASASVGSKPGGSLADSLTGANRDAFLALNAEFTQFGLQSLAPKIYSYIQNGYSADTIALLLQDTPEYKQRFAGNEQRKKNGLAVLSPADYLSTEAAYRQIMSSAGLPATFYDNPSDYATWIGNDVSPTEIKSRVDSYSALTASLPAQTRQTLEQFYGVDDAHLTAYFLDPKRALPILQKQEQAAAFGAEAIQRGLIADRQRMEDYVQEGFSQSTISQGFQQVAEELPNLEALAQRWGTTFNQANEEAAVFGTNANSALARTNLINSEKALFNGSQAATSGGLQQYTGQ